MEEVIGPIWVTNRLPRLWMYSRSMRMCYNIAHQYDQHSEVFISFSHGWNIAAGGGWYKVRDMLDFMNQFSESGGDFFWSLACHSYPAQLGNPCTWDDETGNLLYGYGICNFEKFGSFG